MHRSSLIVIEATDGKGVSTQSTWFIAIDRVNDASEADELEDLNLTANHSIDPLGFSR